MSDVQSGNPGRGDSATGRGPGGGTGVTGGTDSVHQVVFRWDGNHGRQGTGMNAVARSCTAERAEEVGRELGPLLWVSGAAASRPSTVRVLPRDGGVMLVRRWPTTDRGGRPSTVSHVLVGGPGTLKTRQCLGLAYGGWGTRQEVAETASGPLRRIDCAHLDRLARNRLPEMLKRLPTVRDTLAVITAEWLRDPAQRVSLLTEPGERRSGHPDRDETALVCLGLFLIFEPWLRQDWTFATYDAVDTHPLRLMCVPRWEPDTGGSGPLARVTGRPVPDPGFEHWAADRLVDHLLAHPEARPGVPQLVDEFADGATWDWPRRQERLREILDPGRPSPSMGRPYPSTSRPEVPAHGPAPASSPVPVPEPLPEPASDPAPDPAPGQERDRATDPATLAPAPYSGPPYAAPRPTAPYPDHHPAPTSPQYGDPYYSEALAREPGLTGPGIPRHDHDSAGDRGPDHDHDREMHALRQELRDAQRRDPMRRQVMRTRLRALPDEPLVRELRAEDLPPDSVDLLLDELGDPHRVAARQEATRHALCEHVLRKNLYFAPHGEPGSPVSRTAMADRAAHLFTWAVAPLARDSRYLTDLRELLHRMLRDPSVTAGNWLHKAIVAPADGQAPDLPPALWQQIVTDALQRHVGPSAVPPQPASTTATAPSLSSSAPAPERPDFTARLTDLLNKPGCVVGAGAGVIVVLIALVALFA